MRPRDTDESAVEAASTEANPTATTAVKVCPRCHADNEAAARLCVRCLGDVRDVTPTVRTQAPRASNPRAAPARRASDAPRRARWWAAAAIVLVLATAFPHDTASAPLPARSGVSAPVVAGEVWSGPGGGTAGSRVTEAILSPDAGEAWRREWTDEVIALGADAERVYVSLADGRFLALDAQTGEERWSMTVPGQLDQPPAIADRTLYLSLRTSRLVALDASSGAERWSSTVPSLGFVWAAPLVADGLLWVAGQKALNVLEAEDGQPLQVVSHSRQTSAPPVLAEGYVAMATTGEQVVHERATAAQTFNYPLGGILHMAANGRQTVVLTDDAMASTLADASPHWWEGERLRTLWTNAYAWGVAPSIPPPVREWNIALPVMPFAPALDDARVILTDEAGAARGYALADGALLWERPDLGATAAPVLTPEGALVPVEDGLALLDVASGEQVRSWPFDVRPEHLVVTESGTYIAARAASEDGPAGWAVLAIR